MKRIILVILAVTAMLSLGSCGKSYDVYSGTWEDQDAEITVSGDKLTLRYDIVEGSDALEVKNIVKMTGTILSKDGEKYTVCFSDENAVISLQYKVTGDGAEGYLDSLEQFLLLTVKSDADKSLVADMCDGKEISFGTDSAMYTNLSDMPETVSFKLKNGKFYILN